MITFKFVDGYISPVLSTGDIIEVDQLILILRVNIATLEVSTTNVSYIVVH